MPFICPWCVWGCQGTHRRLASDPGRVGVAGNGGRNKCPHSIRPCAGLGRALISAHYLIFTIHQISLRELKTSGFSERYHLPETFRPPGNIGACRRIPGGFPEGFSEALPESIPGGISEVPGGPKTWAHLTTRV